MPIINPDSRRDGAFFHWLGKVNTKDGNNIGTENYKSAHNVRSSEVWMDDIPYAPTVASASAYANQFPGIIRQVGTISNIGSSPFDGSGNDQIGAPGFLFPLDSTEYQSWFLDTGTPSLVPGGQFLPSEEWVKPLINSSDVPNESGKPSAGYSLILYAPSQAQPGRFNWASYQNAFYEVDYFSGIIRFQAGKTPVDPSPGYTNTPMSKTAFEAAAASGQVAAINYIKGNTGGPRAIAYQYVGQTLNTFSSGPTGATGATGPAGATGPTGSAGTSGTSGTSGYSGDKYRFYYTATTINASTVGSTETWTIDTELGYSPAQSIIIAYNTTNYIIGTVSSYNPSTGDMTVDITTTVGSTTYTGWWFNLNGAAGGDGSSGTSGANGSSGTSGTSGVDGSSGTSGTEGTSGTSGTSGFDGTSGTSGFDGTSGTSGFDGTSGTSGTEGTSGTSGTEGTSGTSGIDGSSGTSGTSGTSGLNGDIYRYEHSANLDLGSFPTTLNIGTGLAYSPAQSIIISYDSTHYIQATVNTYDPGTGVITYNITHTEGTGSFNGTWVVNLDGAAGGDGSSGTSGTSGVAGTSGTSGTEGTSGTSGTTGTSGTSGSSGTSGIGIPAGGTSGQVLAKIDGTDYNTHWVDQTGGGGGTPLTVEDYLTGATYGNINNIVFRGNNVVVTPSGLTATGVLVTEDEPVTPGSVMVWIPAPNYVNYFAPTLDTGFYNRYVMRPTTNTISGAANGEYSIGTWDINALFTAGTTQFVKMTNATITAFTTGTSFFACQSNSTNMTFTLYAGDGSVLRTVTGTINNNTTYASSPAGISFTITNFAADNDRFKAKAYGTIDVASLFPYGGRFSWNIRHDNTGALGTPFSFTSSNVFYDSEYSSDAASNAIIGACEFDEKAATNVYYSGVAFYDTGSTFGFTVSGIDNLNDISIPTTKQIDITASNLAISGSFDGFADGTKPAVGTSITGWTYSWNISSLTFSRTGTVNVSGLYIPNFNVLGDASIDNTLNTSVQSYITSNIYDLGTADTLISPTKPMLLDTDVTDSVTYNSNPLDSEVGRLSMTGLSSDSGKGVHPSSSTVLGTATFSSTISLNVAVDELQYIFGRVIFPQTNFTQYYPLVNFSANVNYLNSASASRTFAVYTNAGLSTTNPAYGGGATVNLTLDSYRWHVTSYTKDSGATQQIFNGLITFYSNFAETDMSQGYTSGGSYVTNPDPSLAILIGVDGNGTNTAPNKFIYISGSTTTYGARADQPTYNFNGAANVKRIRWTLGQWGNTINVRRIWLFVGYKAPKTGYPRGAQLWMTDISSTHP